jgi:hypothetical protein
MSDDKNIFVEEKEEVSKDIMEQIIFLCDSMKSLQADISSLEDTISLKKERLQKISRERLPCLLYNLGISKISLNSGEEVSISEKVKPSISNKNYNLAYKNMIEEEYKALISNLDKKEEKELNDVEIERLHHQAVENIDALFKTNLSIEDTSGKTRQILLDNSILFDFNRTIHHKTLEKYCKQMLASGKNIPEGISVFQYQETKIK